MKIRGNAEEGLELIGKGAIINEKDGKYMKLLRI